MTSNENDNNQDTTVLDNINSNIQTDENEKLPSDVNETDALEKQNVDMTSNENDNLANSFITIIKRMASEFADQFALKYTTLMSTNSSEQPLQEPFISNGEAANAMGKQEGGRHKYTRKFRLTSKKNTTRTK